MARINLLFIILISLLSASLAYGARRVVHFAGVTQSHITRDDSSGSGKIHLACLVTVQNVSDIATQEVTEVTMNVYAAVPGDASIQPNVYKNQTGSAAPGSGPPASRTYRFCGSSACAVTGSALPTAGTPLVLEPRGAAKFNSAHFRATALFQYKSTNTYDDGATTPPANQHVFYHCSGSITVQDQATGTSGAAIASGTVEAVGDNYQNPTVRYGIAGFSSQAMANSSRSSTITDYQDLSERNEVEDDAYTETTADCTGSGFCAFSTGPGCGTAGADLIESFFFATYPGSASACYFGGGSTATTTAGYPGYLTSSGTVGLTNTVHDSPATTDYTAFPQHLISVPISINGGKPF